MKVQVHFNEDLISEIAEERYPELVVWTNCCNGNDCGCQGEPEAENSNAIEALEKEIIEDKHYFMEFIAEYEERYTIKEVFND